MNKNKVITIIAYHYHYDIMLRLIRLLDIPNIIINVITSHENTAEILSANPNTNIYFSKDSDISQNILTNIHLLEASNTIIIVTLFKHFRLFYKISRKFKISLLLHNTHFTFSDRRYKTTPINIARTIIQFISRDSFYKKKFISEVGIFYLLSSTSLQYAQQNYSHLSGKMRFLPHWYTERIQVAKKKPITITIPGGINSPNRDYRFFINWLNKQQSLNLEIRFLGKSEKRHITAFKSQINPNKNIALIQFYNYHLDQFTYDQALMQSHILLVPLKETVYFRGYREIYGKSKNSGALFDSMRFSIPLLMPSSYEASIELCKNVIWYDDQDSFDNSIYAAIQEAMSPSTSTSGTSFSNAQRDLISLLGLI